MPSIVIREVDLSTVPQGESTTNTVYMPGYAIMGPVNEPVLCSTISDFRKTFGTVPYKFKNPQSYQNIVSEDITETLGLFNNANTYEKSYMIASELLSQGMPVIYERVMSASDIATWTAKKEITGEGTTPVAGYYMLKLATAYSSATIAANDKVSNVSVYVAEQGATDIANAFYIGTFTIKATASISLDTTKTMTSTAISQSSFTVDNPYKFSAKFPGEYYTKTSFTLKETAEHVYALDVSLDGDAPVRTVLTSDISKVKNGVVYIPDIIGKTDNSGIIVIEALVPGVTITSPVNLELAPSDDDEFTVSSLYAPDASGNTILGGLYDKLEDRGEYVLRFISSGAYPTVRTKASQAAQKMLEVARDRGDCTALIDDVYNGKVVDPIEPTSTYAAIKSFMSTTSFSTNSITKETVDSYGATFIPYARYQASTVREAGTGMPYKFDTYASFAYLFKYAQSVATGANQWDAIAGFQRGTVSNCVELLQPVTNAIADECQPRDDYAINVMCVIKPQGFVIWGNRTLKNNVEDGDLTHQSFLNIRNACSSIKRQVYISCKSLTFQKNTDILWATFRSKITPLLDRMVTGGGIKSYQVIRVQTQKKATVAARIVVTPIEAVEDWDITLELADGTATVTE